MTQTLPDVTNRNREELLKLAETTEALKKRYRERYIDFIMPATGPYCRDKYFKAMEFFKAGGEHRFRMLGGANGCLPLKTTLVCMADGTKKPLGDVQVGEMVLCYNIKDKKSYPAQVLQTFNNGLKEVFRIHFSDGQYVDATANHIFPRQRCSGRYLSKRGLKKPNNIKKVRTDALNIKNRLLSPAVIEYSKQKDLSLHPYLLGCLLGDGCLGYRGKSFINDDIDVLRRVNSHWPLKHRPSNEFAYTLVQEKVGTRGNLNLILEDLNLNVRGELKFIPQAYLTASVEDRKQLLAGLIDTDGSINDFTNKSEQLVKDFAQVVRSLGGKGTISKVTKTCTNNGAVGTYYRCYWRLNTLLPLSMEYKQKITKRPVDYTNRIITKIESIGTDQVGCLEVADKDHCFLVNDFVAVGNSGKSFTGALELAYHITGEYPDWWEEAGCKIQDNPRQWWIVCKSAGTFKSSLQRLLIGETLNDEDYGTGLIPRERLVGYSGWPSVSGTVGAFQVRHKKGHIVTVEVKSSEQDRANLQAANLDGILFDEEPPIDIYTECVFRLRGSPRKKPGISMLLFTPLNGLSEVVLQYLEAGQYPQHGVHSKDQDKYVVRVDMEDVPHLTEEDKRMYMNQSTAADRCARLHGLPALGSGRVYPVDEDQIKVNYLKIAPHWPRAYGMDFGWNKTAVIWGAKDPETGILYLYGEYYLGHLAPYQHVHAIKERGAWIPGAADPRGDKGSERDGSKLLDEYISLGLNLQVNMQGKSVADNASNAGIARCLNMMESGTLRVCYNLENWFKEFRVFRYDPKDPNKLAKNQDDHLMDAMKYLVSCFDDIAVSALEAEQEMTPDEQQKLSYQRNAGRNSITGY